MESCDPRTTTSIGGHGTHEAGGFGKIPPVDTMVPIEGFRQSRTQTLPLLGVRAATDASIVCRSIRTEFLSSVEMLLPETNPVRESVFKEQFLAATKSSHCFELSQPKSAT